MQVAGGVAGADEGHPRMELTGKAGRSSSGSAGVTSSAGVGTG